MTQEREEEDGHDHEYPRPGIQQQVGAQVVAHEVEDHPVLQAARRERLGSAAAGFQMGVPLNELNRVFDLGFKPMPWGDQGFIPKSMIKAG